MTEQSVGSPLSMHDPRTVGPWAVHSRLGAGGMGVVFYATHSGAAAALKVIRPGLLDAPATRDRFRREVAILRSVRDLHICEYLDADLEHDPAWLALEYLSGPTLRDQVLSSGPLPETDWWELTRGLAQALAVLEIHRITHRDLKPGNVILNERGPVLIDFGIAHPEDATQLTATGLVTGSPAWLSPEQANLDPTGPAADIFTLGSLLAFAGTGRPPFGEGASIAVLMSILKKEPDLDGLDVNRQALLRRLMAKDPTQRPTARDVLDLARQAQAGTLLDHPGPAAPAGSPDRAAGLGVGPAASSGAQSPGEASSGTQSSPAQSSPGRSFPGQSSSAQSTPASSSPGESFGVQSPGAGPAAPSVTGASAGGTTQPELPAAAYRPVVTGAAVPPPLAPPPQRRTGSRDPGPRTIAAQERRRRRRRALLVALAVVLVAVAGWLAVDRVAGSESGADRGSSEQSGSASGAPAAPTADQLRSGDWVLESYQLHNGSGGMTVSGTVRNRGTSPGSADLTLWIYVGGESLGSVSTSVSDVPAGGTVAVTMTGDAVWQPGKKVVLLEAS